MPERAPTLPEIETLTHAIRLLHPAIMALEAMLREADRMAAEKQDQMARSLDRLACALETLVTGQSRMQEDMVRDLEVARILAGAVTRLDQRLSQDQARTARLEAMMTDLLGLLDGPA